MSEADIRDNIGAVIREKGYIQAVIAKKAGLTPMQLSAIINKNRNLEANEFFRICDAVELTPSELRNYTTGETESA